MRETVCVGEGERRKKEGGVMIFDVDGSGDGNGCRVSDLDK